MNAAAEPRLWRALIALVSPATDRADILRDLAEEHAERLERTPVRPATAWYRRQVLSSLLPLLRRRVQIAARRLRVHPLRTFSMSTLLQDLRFGWRTLRATPLLSGLVIAVLALGIAANTAIFSLMNPILFRPLPYQEPDRLVHMFQVDPTLSGLGSDMIRQSRPTLEAWREASTFEQIAGYYYGSTSLRGEGDAARAITTGYVSTNLLPMLGVEPAIGRSFRPEEGVPGDDSVLLLSHGQWQSQFGADPTILGRQVFLDGEAHTVIGVMDPGFNFPYGEVRAWKPATFDPERWGPDDHGILTLGRLAPGVEPEQARQELSSLLAGLAEEYGGVYAERGVRITELRRALVFLYDILAAMMVALLAATGFVLLIVCANIANLLLSQIGRRRREIAVRTAIGAGRGRIVRQLLTENTLLALAAGSIGWFLARAGIGLVAPVVPPPLFRVGAIEVDATATGFALMLTIVTVIGFGLVPALRCADTRVTEALKETQRGGRRGRFLSRALIFGQVTAATFLCGGAFLAVEVARDFSSLDLGIQPEGVLAVGIGLPRADYPTAESLLNFYSRTLSEAESLPGVESAGFVSELPLDFSESVRSYQLPGDERDSSRGFPQAVSTVIAPGYLASMRIPVLRGRVFDSRDTRDGQPVVLVNRMLAEGLWPDEDPIGRTLVLDLEAEPVETSVIGVVGNTVSGIALNGIQEQVYAPLSQRPLRGGTLTIRVNGDPGELTGGIRSLMTRMDPELPVDDIRTMTAVVAGASTPLVATRNLLAALALFALALAALGVYGVVAYSVSQRTHEIGVRLALGARPRHVRRTVMTAAAAIVIGAAFVGAMGTFGLHLALAAVAGEAAGAPVSALVVAAALTGVALLAAWLPTRRATRIDPLLALRSGAG